MYEIRWDINFRLAVFGLAVEVVITRHESQGLFMEIRKLEQLHYALTEEQGRLQLEQSTWANDARIEEIARETLNMEEPTDTRILVKK